MGEAINETVKLILSLSISGGLFALALFILKPFIRNRLSKSFQYYIWLVVLLRFILPFSFGINLMDFTFKAPNTPQAAEETIIPNSNIANPANINPTIDDSTGNSNKPFMAERQPSEPISENSEEPLNILKTLADNLLWIWLAGAVMSAAFNVFGYFRFIRYIHGAAYKLEMPDCPVRVYKCHFAPTPMLVGVIKPRIYLLDIEYTDGQLQNILLHELTHLRRRDVWLKWFAALVVSIHWFNPIVYFMRREISRACELSCDEAVIRNLDGPAKQDYGDTLISVVAESRYPVGVMSTTMCEEKKKLEERLVAIMNYRKKTKIAVLIAAILAVFLTGSAFAFGTNIPAGTQNSSPLYAPKEVLPSATEDASSILSTYYSGQSTRAFEMLKKKVFANLLDDWTAEIGGIENPAWNYDSFAGYRIVDHDMLSVSRHEELYYCTFSADHDKYGYVVVSYDGSSLQKISVAETPYLYDLRVNIDEIIDRLKDTGIDLSSATASRVKWVDTDKNRSDEAIVFTDDNSGNYVYYFDKAPFMFSSTEGAKQIITLADLRQLAAKGDELTFEDFNDYEGQEVGSGLYILYFKIEGGYKLLVGGGAVTGKPMYANLSITGVEENIDIRFNDIDEFIGKYHVPNELNDQIYQYLDTIMSSPLLSSATGDYIKAHQAEYDAIVDMGIPALPMLRAILDNGDRGLRGNIAALLIQDIVASESGNSHSQWYDGVLVSASRSVEQWSMDFPPNGAPLTRDEERESSKGITGFTSSQTAANESSQKGLVNANFTGVSITGKGPVGIELVRTNSSEVSFEMLGVENEPNCATSANVKDGVMYITVTNSVPGGLNVQFGPDYRNVVRIYIPNAKYTKFEVDIFEMTMQMEDFSAPVQIKGERGGFYLIDTAISQGTYNIKITHGPLKIEAASITTDITASVDGGPITLQFNEQPVNLYLDTTNCGPVVHRPDTWAALYSVGNGTPKIILNNTRGLTTIEVK